jgi:hypothetical protein
MFRVPFPIEETFDTSKGNAKPAAVAVVPPSSQILWWQGTLRKNAEGLFRGVSR